MRGMIDCCLATPSFFNVDRSPATKQVLPRITIRAVQEYTFVKTLRSHPEMVPIRDKKTHKKFEISRLSIDCVNPFKVLRRATRWRGGQNTKLIITIKPEVLEDHLTT